MRAVVGHSDAVEAADAVQEVVEQCRAELKGETPKAALLFMSVDYPHQQILDVLAKEWPGLPLIGGSSDGEISSRFGFAMDSVLLTLLCGDFEAVALSGRNLSDDIEAAAAAASRIPAGFGEPALALTTFAPSTNASQVLRDLDRQIDSAKCPVLGGLTGDHREFSRMVEFCGNEVMQDSLPILYLFGDLDVSWGIGSGWFPIGDAQRVTASQGHVVQEIDGRPALESYQRYYGEVPEGSLGEYPLALFESADDSQWTLRAVMGTNAETGEIRFAGDVPEGCRVRMTEVLREGLLSGTTQSVQQAIESFPGRNPGLALVFSCAARKWVLGSRAEEETSLTRAAFPSAESAPPMAGLYVYGEIAPLAAGASSSLHNETCITVLVGKK